MKEPNAVDFISRVCKTEQNKKNIETYFSF